MTIPKVVYSGKPKPHSWVRWLIGRIKNNNNNLISVVGKTGSGKTWSGKTWSAISVCEIMSKIDNVSFGIDNIVFDLVELMNLINSGKLIKGSKIIFDEPQVSISAREFQSEANKVFNYLLRTFRHRNLTLFFCTPYESLLDKNTRRLFHARFETLSIDKNKKTCRLKPRYLEYGDFKKEPYRKQLIVVFEDENNKTKSHKLFYWDIPKPSKELIAQYEKKKLEFTNRLNKNISERLNKFEQGGKSLTARKERKPLTPTQLKVMRVLANNKYETASKILGISLSAIHKNKILAEKKGYTLEEFRE